MIESKIQQWGNSQGIRLPKHLLDELHMNIGDEISISIENDKIIISPSIRKKKYDIKDLVKQLPKNYKSQRIETGNPQGKEVW